MSKSRIDRIPTRQATLEQLVELRKTAKFNHTKFQFGRKNKELHSGKPINMSREELLWKEELSRLNNAIYYRKRTRKIKEIKREYKLLDDVK